MGWSGSEPSETRASFQRQKVQYIESDDFAGIALRASINMIRGVQFIGEPYGCERIRRRRPAPGNGSGIITEPADDRVRFHCTCAADSQDRQSATLYAALPLSTVTAFRRSSECPPTDGAADLEGRPSAFVQTASLGGLGGRVRFQPGIQGQRSTQLGPNWSIAEPFGETPFRTSQAEELKCNAHRFRVFMI